MKKNLLFFVLLWIVFFFYSCQNDGDTEDPRSFTDDPVPQLNLTEAELYDKVLGMIVGSAIGDAMGAPTEMWSREMIQLEYGRVQGLDSMVRETSPEGIWKLNLPAGGTTDDTRWKKLAFEYLSQENPDRLDPKKFAQKITDQYQAALDNYKEIESFEPEPFEDNTLRVAWLQEWAKVSKPYLEDDLSGFQDALSKFYGGEMVCAGLLYSPAVGAFFPGDPEKAYLEAYELSIFDIGYARDISSLAAGMTAAAMKKGAVANDLLAVARLDPKGYFKSRLVGRASYRILRNALFIVDKAKKPLVAEEITKHQKGDENVLTEEEKNDIQLKKAFQLLDLQQQDMPFHAGEIYLQVLTAMLFSEFDFEKSLRFLVNYGRDNDTTAAVAGSVLGALYGFDKLPVEMKERVLIVNARELETDLEGLAGNLTDNILKRYKKKSL